MGKSQASASKKSKKFHNRSSIFTGYSGKERGFQRSNSRSPSPSVTSIGSVERIEKDIVQILKPNNPGSRGRSPHHFENVSGSRSETKNSTVKSKA
ncbi:DNA/RNA polymerases superfamily protein [Gossypium australe]|uniref:DNA/RNA polymerases superfamily protein n=1 Tax=Gossypium australe TaxID=47621 RepID=A0A5B6V8W5_9ROSI|nr:DNA/RNA polymerases superfamily protein [Gossypium australe]